MAAACLLSGPRRKSPPSPTPSPGSTSERPSDPLQIGIGVVAVFLGAANAAGGFVVTERMLAMFKTGQKKDGKQGASK